MAWPAINNSASQGDPGKVYDLWHAAINSRGLAFSAESPADLIGALKASLNRIKAPLAAQSAAATSSSTLNSGTVVYPGELHVVGLAWHVEGLWDHQRRAQHDPDLDHRQRGQLRVGDRPQHRHIEHRDHDRGAVGGQRHCVLGPRARSSVRCGARWPAPTPTF